MRPRLGVLIPLCYGAGLATGLLRFGAPVSAVGMTMGAALLLGRRQSAALLATCLAIGALSGEIAAAADTRGCAARLPTGELAVTVRVTEPAYGEGIGGATPATGCAGAVDVRWAAEDTLSAGDIVELRGRWIPRPGPRAAGLLVVSRARRTGAHPSFADRIRTAATGSIHRLYGKRAAIVGALVLNSRGAMDPGLRDEFAQSGLVHILSISGFHVGLIAAWVVLVARAVRLSRSRSLAVGAVVGTAYVAFLGWPAPATRAAALVSLLALAQFRQRKTGGNAILAVSCLLVMLIDPWSVLDLGAWLSAGALWGAMTFTRWSDRAFGDGYWPRTLFSSIGATLATAPFTSALLGAVAPVGVALNFMAIPVAAVAVPGVLASLLAEPVWSGLARALATGSGIALNGLEALARLGASVPGGHVVTDPGVVAAIPWLLALVITLWAMGRRNTRREAVRRSAVALVAWSWCVALSHGLPATDAASGLTLHFLDVGQGDAAVLRTPGGHWILIDAGPVLGSEDAGRRVVAPFLERHGVRRLAAVVISHAHADHVGGATTVLHRIPADVIIEPGEIYSDPVYYNFLDAAAAAGVPWRAGRAGSRFEIDGVRFSILHPDTTWAEWHADLNEDSVVLRVEYGAFTAIFAGDAGLPAESLMAGHAGRADLLKVGHHGSRGATGDAWLAELAPRAAIVSVGARNRYGHPSPDAMTRLARHGVPVWRTDREGDVTVLTDGHTMTVSGRHGSVTIPVE